MITSRSKASWSVSLPTRTSPRYVWLGLPVVSSTKVRVPVVGEGCEVEVLVEVVDGTEVVPVGVGVMDVGGGGDVSGGGGGGPGGPKEIFVSACLSKWSFKGTRLGLDAGKAAAGEGVGAGDQVEQVGEVLDADGHCEAAADDLCRGWEKVAEVGEGERGARCRSAGLELQAALEQPS